MQQRQCVFLTLPMRACLVRTKSVLPNEFRLLAQPFEILFADKEPTNVTGICNLLRIFPSGLEHTAMHYLELGGRGKIFPGWFFQCVCTSDSFEQSRSLSGLMKLRDRLSAMFLQSPPGDLRTAAL